MSVEMAQDLADDGVLGDERDDLHLSAALVTCQRVDFVDAVDELSPSSVEGPSRRWCIGLVLSRLVSWVGSSDAIGIGAIEMNQVFVGLWDVDKDTREKLERVDEGFVVDGESVFGFVDDESGVWVEPES